MESIDRWRVSFTFYGTKGRERKVRFQFFHIAFTKDRCEINETFFDQAYMEAMELMKEAKAKSYNGKIEIQVTESRLQEGIDTSNLYATKRKTFTIGENDVY